MSCPHHKRIYCKIGEHFLGAGNMTVFTRWNLSENQFASFKANLCPIQWKCVLKNVKYVPYSLFYESSAIGYSKSET